MHHLVLDFYHGALSLLRCSSPSGDLPIDIPMSADRNALCREISLAVIVVAVAALAVAMAVAGRGAWIGRVVVSADPRRRVRQPQEIRCPRGSIAHGGKET